MVEWQNNNSKKKFEKLININFLQFNENFFISKASSSFVAVQNSNLR